MAVDCIIFGYDGQELKLLVVKGGLNHLKDKWSLVGGFVQENESAEGAAARVLKDLTGLMDYTWSNCILFQTHRETRRKERFQLLILP